MSSETRPESESGRHLQLALRLGVVLLFLCGFLVAIQMMGGSIKLMGEGAAGSLFDGVSNPFAGLSVGVLATVMCQSSSATTSLIVGLVGSGGATALPITSAVPMVMGANIGTTVTNTIVSIGHIRRGAEFHRAFAAAHFRRGILFYGGDRVLPFRQGDIDLTAVPLCVLTQGDKFT